MNSIRVRKATEGFILGEHGNVTGLAYEDYAVSTATEMLQKVADLLELNVIVATNEKSKACCNCIDH